MKVKQDDGGPAFPWDHSNNTEYTDIRGGMSLRDYFATQAMATLIDVETAAEMGEGRTTFSKEYVAKEAYQMADAMLKERAK